MDEKANIGDTFIILCRLGDTYARRGDMTDIVAQRGDIPYQTDPYQTDSIKHLLSCPDTAHLHKTYTNSVPSKGANNSVPIELDH